MAPTGCPQGLYIIIILLRFLMSLRPCVTEGHLRSLDLEPKAAASLGHWLLETTERMPLCTAGKALHVVTCKNMSIFNVLDNNQIRVCTYF